MRGREGFFKDSINLLEPTKPWQPPHSHILGHSYFINWFTEICRPCQKLPTLKIKWPFLILFYLCPDRP